MHKGVSVCGFVCEAQVCVLAPPSGGSVGYVCVSKSSRSLSSVFPPNPPKMNTCRSTSTELKESKPSQQLAERCCANPTVVGMGVCVFAARLLWRRQTDHRSAGGVAVLSWGHCRVAQAKLGGVSGYSTHSRVLSRRGLRMLPCGRQCCALGPAPVAVPRDGEDAARHDAQPRRLDGAERAAKRQRRRRRWHARRRFCAHVVVWRRLAQSVVPVHFLLLMVLHCERPALGCAADSLHAVLWATGPFVRISIRSSYFGCDP